MKERITLRESGGGGDGGVLRRWGRWKIEKWLRRRIIRVCSFHSHANIVF
jgi:hypothetical protein